MMLHQPYGPRGAENEEPEFWTDLTRETDPTARDARQTESLSGLSAQEPYSPVIAHGMQGQSEIDPDHDENGDFADGTGDDFAGDADLPDGWTGEPNEPGQAPQDGTEL